MPRISDGVMNLINAAKEKGMIFYGLGINISEITDCQVYEVIDRMWFYQNNICYKIYEKTTKLGLIGHIGFKNNDYFCYI